MELYNLEESKYGKGKRKGKGKGSTVWKIVTMSREGKSTKEIAVALSRCEQSVQWRIERVLSKVQSLEQIEYRSGAQIMKDILG